jgi:hypothetical protein
MANIRRALLTSEDAWKNLQKFYDENGTKLNMPSMFSSDPSRFEKFRYARTFFNFIIYNDVNVVNKI